MEWEGFKNISLSTHYQSSAVALPCEINQQLGALASSAFPQTPALPLITLKLEEIWKVLVGSFLAVSDAFNLWGIEKRRDKVHLVSRVTTGLRMIYDFKDKGVKNWLFSSRLSWDLHVWIKHTQVMGYSVSPNCRVVYVKPEAFSSAFSCLFRSREQGQKTFPSSLLNSLAGLIFKLT